MGAFKTQKVLDCNPALVSQIASAIQSNFQADGFEVGMKNSSTGSVNISISKGGMFKAVLGMKTSLNITLEPKTSCIFFEAGVGIFGEQFVPTVISMFFLWPVLLTQIWGMIQQASLDDRALQIAEGVIRNSQYAAGAGSQKRYCIYCSAEISAEAVFCPKCGRKQE